MATGDTYNFWQGSDGGCPLGELMLQSSWPVYCAKTVTVCPPINAKL